MSDTTPAPAPTRRDRLEALYDRGQITRCHNLFDIAFISIAFPLALLIRAHLG